MPGCTYVRFLYVLVEVRPPPARKAFFWASWSVVIGELPIVDSQALAVLGRVAARLTAVSISD